MTPLDNLYDPVRRLGTTKYHIHDEQQYYDDTIMMAPYLELSSISNNNFDGSGSSVTWSGARLNGIDDYVTIKNAPISGPAFFGVMVAVNCDDCIIFTIPMTITDYWSKVYAFSSDGHSLYIPQQSDKKNAEVIAYVKGTSIRMMLRIEGENDVVSEVTSAFTDSKWVYVAYEVALDLGATNLGGFSVPKQYDHNLVVYKFGTTAGGSPNRMSLIENSVYYPAYDRNQEFYIGTYRPGASYHNFKGNFAEFTFATHVGSDITLNDIIDLDRAVMDEWLDCDPFTEYYVDIIGGWCAECHPTCIHGCENSSECDLYGNDWKSPWSCDIRFNGEEDSMCNGCRGNAVLFG
jgi:hypothetical protein